MLQQVKAWTIAMAFLATVRLCLWRLSLRTNIVWLSRRGYDLYRDVWESD